MYKNNLGIEIEKVRGNEIQDVFKFTYKGKEAYTYMPKTMGLSEEYFDDITVEEFNDYLDEDVEIIVPQAWGSKFSETIEKCPFVLEAGGGEFSGGSTTRTFWVEVEEGKTADDVRMWLWDSGLDVPSWIGTGDDD